MYKLYDKNNKIITMKDLQDKKSWCKHGFDIEKEFILKYKSIVDGFIINPNKLNDIYDLDLYSPDLKMYADLKTQNTPFFQAQQRYNINPQYAVVFNKKDKENYDKKLIQKDFYIYFWVNWKAVKFETSYKVYRVNPMENIWRIRYSKLSSILMSCALHSYKQRQNDKKGNAKESYVFDIRNPNFLKIL